MEKLILSQVLGELIQTHVSTSISGGRDCRLLVPGLSPEIARQVHEYLLCELPQLGVIPYLVICEDEQPSEEKGKIPAIGLTSKRIGSFVAVVSPGQLVHIQDSIRGSGGPIRSLAFSEEWPWIDNGNEQFRFDGPVLETIVKKWSKNTADQKWLYEFILKGLLEYSRTSPRRGQIFLGDIIGTFSPDLYPEISDVKEKLLYHAGIPRPSGTLPAAKKLIEDSARISRKIVERFQKEEDLREQVMDMTSEVIPVDESESVKQSLGIFLDGVGRSTMLDLGLLAFFGCWGQDRNNTSHWSRLSAERLMDLFGVKQREKAEVNYIVSCPRGIISDDGKKLATFLGEQIILDIDYRIPADQFSGRSWAIRILNRQQIIAESSLNTNEGQVQLHFNIDNIRSKLNRKVPIKIALIANGNVQADQRLDLHVCGPNRPAFVIIERSFDVIDATLTSEEENPDKKIIVNTPIHVFLLSNDSGGVALCNEDLEDVGVIETGKTGIWQSSQRIDVTAEPSGQVIRICRFNDARAVICFEATDIEKGEFTIEDELRVLIAGGREKRLHELVELFKGTTRDPYLALGRVDKAARRKIDLAKIITTRTGWRPLLMNLLEPVDGISGSRGDFINYLGSIEAETFVTLKFPPEALSLLRAYSDAREAILSELESSLDTHGISIEHPIYASHPIYVQKRTREIESLLCSYLEAYSNILDYLQSTQKDLEWSQIFVLTHLDCVVHWDNTRLRNAFFFVGPWHPLILAKRFMVQATLFSRACRLIDEPEGKLFRQFSSLLGRVPGFYWILGLSADDRMVEPAYVSRTSDPAWHVAFKTNCHVVAAQEGIGGLPEISMALWRNLGLAMEIGVGGCENLAVVALSNYVQAFPSRRSIGIRVRGGYPESKIVSDVDIFLHSEEGPTVQGQQLPGGIRLYFEKPLAGEIDARWSDPLLCVYHFNDDNQCVRETHPDIYMVPPVGELSFRSGTETYELPRGTGINAVFAEPLRWLTEGHTLVPKSITYEFDTICEPSDGIGGAFIKILGQFAENIKARVTAVSSFELPLRLKAPWVIIPGQSIDPAVLVKYVRDGADRELQDRALWDYKMDVVGPANSFYILSTIPRGFEVSVNGFFNREDNTASRFIVELGKIGIAIGGEALKSGRHALGIIGLIGAVRLLTGKGKDGRTPLEINPNTVGLLIPVDSFTSFFGKTGIDEGKRTDLLAIQIILPENDADKLKILACGVESKFFSKTLGITRAHSALAQGLATTHDFKKLVTTSLLASGMPERLALLELLRFGLRVKSPSKLDPNKPDEIGEWVNTERVIYKAILEGNYDYIDARYKAILVSTEGSLPGVAEHVELPEGLWIRLTKSHWPGIADTQQLDAIRQVLYTLFEGKAPEGLRVHPHPEPAPLKEEQEPPISEPVEGDGDTLLEGIFIAVDEARRMVYYDPQSPVDPLENMHIMVTGSSGTGKTQLLKYLICKIREQGKNILILDFKNDFASDAIFCEKASIERMFVAFDGLPYNPLIPYPIRQPVSGELFIQSAQYIAGVASVLKQTYGLGAQQQAAVKNAIVQAFQLAGIPTTGTTPYTMDLRFPDFSHVGISLEHDNPSAYNRLDPLFTLGLFREEFQGQSFQSLVNRSIVLDLSQIPSDEIKNALAQLIVLSAHAYYNSMPQPGAIRQFLVFDEAHRVLNSDYMLKLVRECRSYGVGTILSSQYPSDFPSEISASMATKIIHGNGRDVDKVKEIVKLLGCDGREGDVSNLGRFQAFIDNHHFPHTLIRTMNYPLYLVWENLQRLRIATREELSQTRGIDTTKLSIGNLVQQLELLGLAEEKDGKIIDIRYPRTGTP